MSGGAETNPLDAAPSRFASLGGTKLHYKSLGTGETALVFVHCWTGDLTFWSEQVPAFDRRIRMVLVDLPGHGRSGRPDTPYTMDLFARSVEAVVREAGVARAVLVGHSMGTPVARQVYRLHPEKTLAIVDVDGMLHLDLSPDEAGALAARYAGENWRARQRAAIEGMFSPATSPALRRKVRDRMTAAPQDVAAGAYRATFDPAIWTDDSIDVPVLAVYARSAFRTPEYEAAVRRIARDVRIVYVEDAGHFLQMEKPAEVNAVLTSFLIERGLLAG